MSERKYHHGSLKPALVAAGLDLLEDGGLDTLSLRAIAAKVGVSHAAPKNHFANLRGLLTAMGAEGFRRHAAAMRAGLPPGASREHRRLAALEGYVAFARAHPHLFALMFSSSHCDFRDPELSAAARDSYAVLSDIAEGFDVGPGPDRQARAEMFLWSLCHGYATLDRVGMFGPSAATHAPAYPIAEIMPPD